MLLGRQAGRRAGRVHACLRVGQAGRRCSSSHPQRQRSATAAVIHCSLRCSASPPQVERDFRDLASRGDPAALGDASEAKAERLVVAARALELAEEYYKEARAEGG